MSKERDSQITKCKVVRIINLPAGNNYLYEQRESSMLTMEGNPILQEIICVHLEREWRECPKLPLIQYTGRMIKSLTHPLLIRWSQNVHTAGLACPSPWRIGKSYNRHDFVSVKKSEWNQRMASNESGQMLPGEDYASVSGLSLLSPTQKLQASE